ncbi:HAD-like domain-containing protein [Catenaria anguillulae PL171]|uniref:HAD-like domain-containing protein n=1 Tax=Catenaria anguillulae PL171 TaxID=765915 RepID=A0A1Y2I439_9FUNG|nr:HAD-like domain-containing protein [Catenaria anguillulae PL171]
MCDEGGQEGVVPANVVLATSVVTGGRGTFIVIATGSHTRLAAMGGLPPLKQPKTVLAKFMKQLAASASIAAVSITILVTLFGVFALGRPWQEMFLFGLTLVFVTLPEELPLMVKLVLASTAGDLARNHNVLVRRLRSLEQLADIKALVTDKTGTLTQGVMSLAGVWFPMSNSMSPPPPYPSSEPKISLTNSNDNDSATLLDLPTAWSLSAIHPADPYDAAVRSVWRLTPPQTNHDASVTHDSYSSPSHSSQGHAHIGAHSHLVLESRIDPATMIRETVRDWAPLGTLTILRGAPEVILARATHITSDNGLHAVPLGKTLRAAVHARWASVAGSGYRMIAVAMSISSSSLTSSSSTPSLAASSVSSTSAPSAHPSVTSGSSTIVCLGCLAFSDPLRAGAHAFLATARSNGTHLVLATGDHPGTAHAVDRALGSVFSEVHSRCTPEHKRRLVEHLAHTYGTGAGGTGGVLAVGDGGNDAPAMRAASVAAVMANSPGRADAALDSADLILLGDEGLKGLAYALRVAPWARIKVRQAVAFYLGCKVALVSLTCVTLGVLGTLPLTPPMLLVQEISMDLGATLVFASEPFPEHLSRASGGVGEWKGGLMRWTLACGVVLGMPSILAYVLGLTSVVDAGPEVARTMAFATYVPAQAVTAYAMRSPVAPIRAHGFWAPMCLGWAAINVLLTVALVGTGAMGFVPLAREAVMVCVEVRWSAREKYEGRGSFSNAAARIGGAGRQGQVQ